MTPVAVIVSGARTPIGRFLGGLSPLAAPDLGATAIRAAIERAGIDPANIDEVIMGNVVQAGVGQAPARQAMIRAGVPASVPAFTINKVCGSGLQAVMLAAQAIKAGDANMIVAGGMESMSNAPFLVYGMRGGVTSRSWTHSFATACGIRSARSTWAATPSTPRRRRESRAPGRTSSRINRT